MKAAVLREPRKVRIEEVPLPEIARDEVLIAVRAAGICGTDVLVYSGRLASERPIIPGHEFTGQIAAVGGDVEGFSEGDRVFTRPGWSCGRCTACRKGDEASCSDKKNLGQNTHGAFAEYVKVPAFAVARLPAGISYEEGQSLGPLRCALRALERVSVRGREIKQMAILGPGHAGLILMQVFAEAGIPDITMFGTRRDRLDLARSLGAQGIVNVREEDPVARTGELTQGRGFDLVAEASGSSEAAGMSLRMVKNQGMVLIFGVADSREDNLSAREVYHKELDIIGSRGGAGAQEEAVRLLQSGRISILPLLSPRLDLDDLGRGFRLIEQKAAGVLRVLVYPQKQGREAKG